MYSVDEALDRILAVFPTLPGESVSLAEAHRRTLAADVIAGESLPPFDNSAMDGFALRAADTAGASAEKPVTLRVVADIPAGRYEARPIGPGEAARIMTGAAMPPGADCIVPVELTDQPPGRIDPGAPLPAQVGIYAAANPRDNVRYVGEDVQTGQVVLRKGRILRPADVGLLAGLGIPAVTVTRRPRVAVLSTGDELLEADAPLVPGKIRDMNRYTLIASVEALGGQPIPLGIARDSLDEVTSRLQMAVEAGADLILSSAGVSVGAFDVVKAAIEAMGSIGFWKVNMRPGRPLAFGQVAGVPFLGLPGNPVSALVTFDVFARPAILKMLGRDHDVPLIEAELATPLTSDGRRTFARVRIERAEGRHIAYSTGSQSSGVLSSLVYADGLMIVPEGMGDLPAGTRLPVRLFDPA